jgi:putative flippase GtrA
VAGAAQYLGWRRFGGVHATEGSPAERRAALRRWVKFATALQVGVVAFAVAYLVLLSRHYAHGGLWAAPAIGVIVGTALPLQVVVSNLLRALR